MTSLGAFLEVAAAVLAGATVAAAYAGPLHIDLLWTTISIRTLARPAVAAAIIVAARLWLLRGPAVAVAASVSIGRVVVGALAAAGVIGWIAFLSTTCGGADSYGYVSAADRLLAADLASDEPLAALLPFPNAIAAVCPLGYVPSGRVHNQSVPAYPLGLPVLMAVGKALVGSIGPFVVAPAMGLLLLTCAFLAARSWYRDVDTGLLAAAMAAVNPLVFTYAIQPMSDVPAAAAVMAAVAALSAARPRPFLAGAAAAVALLIRPALGLLALALSIAPLLTGGGRSWRSSLRYLAPVALAVVVQGWTQWYLYGDPFGSGYGRITGLFSVETAAANIRSYGYWAALALGPVWIALTFVGLVTSDWRSRVVTCVVAVSVGAPYLFYRPYDHWETLRFLLPAIAVATVVAAHGLMRIAAIVVGPHQRGLVVAAIVFPMAWAWMSWLTAANVFTMPANETRHRMAGELVAQVTPPNAVVLALQHTGSVRFYAGRQTINWDRIPAGTFADSVKALQSAGLPVYLMLDSEAERAMFTQRHGNVVDADRWLPSGQRRNVQLYQAPAPVP